MNGISLAGAKSTELDVRSLTTKELSRTTWPDFEKLFTKHNGVGGCWCMHYHRISSTEMKGIQGAERGAKNRRDMKSLVNAKRSHGILVYYKGMSIGWCQYGSREELPRIDRSRNYKRLNLKESQRKLWRITCFVIDRDFRRRGVAKTALNAVLNSIKSKGGGVVEAYPVTAKASREWSKWSNWLWFGTAPMFRMKKFKIVGKLGPRNLLMSRNLTR